jgi:hypothetical protein
MPAPKDEVLWNRNRYRAVPVVFDAFMLGTRRVELLELSLPNLHPAIKRIKRISFKAVDARIKSDQVRA